MKKCVNGKIVDMTPEEIEEMKRHKQEQYMGLTVEERLELIENALIDLSMTLGGE